MAHEVRVKDGAAYFTMEDGREIMVAFEDRLGIDGYMLCVMADPSSKLLVIPGASNSIRLVMDRSLKKLDELVDAAVANRKKNAKPTR